MTLLAEHQGAHAVATGPKGSVSRSSEGIAGTQRFIEKVAGSGNECDFRMRERWGFWLKRLPIADSESLPTVLVAAMPRYVGHVLD